MEILVAEQGRLHALSGSRHVPHALHFMCTPLTSAWKFVSPDWDHGMMLQHACPIALLPTGTAISVAAAMGTRSVSPLPAPILDLPMPWLTRLFQQIASGAGGLPRAAVLSQTCRFFNKLSDSSAVSYTDIQFLKRITSAHHPIWQWLAKRQGRIDSLTLKIDLCALYNIPQSWRVQVGVAFEQLGTAGDPLQQLHSMPLVHLEVYGYIGRINGSPLSQLLRLHGRLLEKVSVCVMPGIQGGLPLQEACECMATCRSIKLDLCEAVQPTLNISCLTRLRQSLVQLDLSSFGNNSPRSLDSWSTISSLTRLTALRIENCKLPSEDPWAPVAALGVSLRDLNMWKVAADGDATPLSALTGLTFLQVFGRPEPVPLAGDEGVAPLPFSFSSLQPLSTMQQLQTLWLADYGLSATSLEGLAGLSSLRTLTLSKCRELVSLEGVSTTLTYLSISFAPAVGGLQGLGSLGRLQQLELKCCGVTSLEPLATGLRSLTQLEISEDQSGMVVDANGDDVPVGAGVVPALISIRGVEGLGSCLRHLCLVNCRSLQSICGLEKLHALKDLNLLGCGVTSLQPLGMLRAEGLRCLTIAGCSQVQEEVLEMPYVPATMVSVMVEGSNLREVVIAGGAKRALFTNDRRY